jgi:hypothetical protein
MLDAQGGAVVAQPHHVLGKLDVRSLIESGPPRLNAGGGKVSRSLTRWDRTARLCAIRLADAVPSVVPGDG